MFIHDICHHSCPAIFVSDQGRELVNALSQGLLTKTKAEHHTTSAYHSQVHKCALYLITFHA